MPPYRYNWPKRQQQGPWVVKAAAQGQHPPTGALPSGAIEASPRTGDQVSQVACILSHHVEALTAINAELLKAALVGSATARSSPSSTSTATPQSPEIILEGIHDAVVAAQRDCLHLVGEQEKEAWSRATWDVYHLVQGSLQRMLFGLHELGADMGSSTAAMQAADCLANGSLVPRDPEAAFKWYQRASSMGSAAASLKCGVHYFNGDPPTGHDPAKAYEYFSRALDQSKAALDRQRERSQQQDAAFDTLTSAERDAAVHDGGLYMDALRDQQNTALTWLGRCYLEGCGVPRDVAQAAQLFREAENRDELQELAMLKQQFEQLHLPGL
ncbi:hypothetical protein N2152v2_000545 [Parachlorella kessleri]